MLERRLEIICGSAWLLYKRYCCQVTRKDNYPRYTKKFLAESGGFADLPAKTVMEEKMRGFNKVVLMGNLTRDPESRTTPNGQSVTSFSLAVNRTWKGADGQQQEAVDYIDCDAWAKGGEIIAQYMKKGGGILVSGRLQFRSWEQDGQKRSKVSVVVEDFNFVGGGNQNSGGGGDYQSSSPSPAASKPKDKDVVITDVPDGEIDLSEIPF